jgi:hypothetical protein
VTAVPPVTATTTETAETAETTATAETTETAATTVTAVTTVTAGTTENAKTAIAARGMSPLDTMSEGGETRDEDDKGASERRRRLTAASSRPGAMTPLPRGATETRGDDASARGDDAPGEVWRVVTREVDWGTGDEEMIEGEAVLRQQAEEPKGRLDPG